MNLLHTIYTLKVKIRWQEFFFKKTKKDFSEGFAKIIHPIFEVLGYFVGFHYYQLIKKKSPTPDLDKYRVWILLAVVSGALIFSRVVAIFEHIHLIDDATPLSFYIGQKTIVGGLLGGLLFIEITKKILNIKRSTIFTKRKKTILFQFLVIQTPLLWDMH